MPELVHDADPPLIDAYLIHWRAPEWCVPAAASMLASAGVRVRCTVVDNGGIGGSALAQALDPRIDVITTEENLGYTGAANHALKRALSEARRAEFIVIAAHDAHVEPGAFAALSA